MHTEASVAPVWLRVVFKTGKGQSESAQNIRDYAASSASAEANEYGILTLVNA
ncbi:MAG: hypothetical protein GY822_16830 [Deltaproteobacteria bacterium]|nr:hypothetical protein [Deltaproteobacteria bacterium]